MAGGALGNNLTSTINQMSGRGQGIGGIASEVGRVLAPPTSRGYVPSYSVPQNAQLPVLQSTQRAPAQQVQQAGLQALMANMMAQYPNMRGTLAMPQQGFMPQQNTMQPMPQYRASALSYKPSMQPAQQSLNRVAVSVAEQQRRAAVAEAERLRAENEALQAQQSYNYDPYWYSGGGG